MQSPTVEAVVDEAGTHAGGDKLASRDDPVLGIRKRRDPSIARIRSTKLLLALYIPVNCRFVRHVTRMAALIAHVTRGASRLRAERRANPDRVAGPGP